MHYLKSTLRILLIILINLFVLRVIETLFVIQNHGYIHHLFIYELIGLSNDFVLFTILVFILRPFNKIKIFQSDVWFITLLCIYNILHITILNYFAYQLELLDIFLFQYTFKEIKLTIGTSSTNLLTLSFSIIISLTVLIILYHFINKLTFNKRLRWLVLLITFVTFSASIGSNLFNRSLNQNKFAKNKSSFFYKRSLKYAFIKSDYKHYDQAVEFQKLYSTKEFLNTDYPLLHTFRPKNILGNLIRKTDSTPNIVILIVEGLNNDFIDKYHGLKLMPFLNELSNKSLYWNRCFTLGERSFAVLPSIIGGLPYGEKGFTLQQKYPYHHTLISLLNKNNYHTSFFYGQGSWFHHKDAFLRYNNIDLILDNSKFFDNYDKIIVDDFFWGYNDKDLFDQSLRIIDTLKDSKRLDIYFTGTSHSPFEISNNKYYDKKLENIFNHSKADSSFFKVYKKYLRSLLFVDDALKNFFAKYKKRDDFNNTVFIITGDHPMTELPIKNSLKRYHVPLIIYSPQLIKARKFNSIVSHLDIYETILAFLKYNYNLNLPEYSASMGSYLDTLANNENRNLAFMNDNREIVDLYSDGYYLSSDQRFKVDKHLDLHEIENDSLTNVLRKKLIAIKETSYYTSTKNKIIPVEDYCNHLGYNKLYYLSNNNEYKIKSKYYNLIKQLPIPNLDNTLQLSFDYSGISDTNTSVVLELKDSDGKSLLWKNQSLSPKNETVQYRVYLSKQDNKDTTIYLNVYLWNKSKNNFKISNITHLIYKD